ncbi:MAG: LCP family protein [Actinomycetota bacterium]|nr:LCP family protein [Actinomycetota bacterium]
MPAYGARSRPTRRTWPERLAIGVTIVAAVVAFAAAGGLTVGYMLVGSRQVVDLTNPAEAAGGGGASAATPTAAPPSAPGTKEPDETSIANGTVLAAPDSTAPPTFPTADPEASNFLVTGADNGACVDPDSPYAPAFADREGTGERSDTIIVFRVDPVTSRVAILSFPRDLYVEIADSGNLARINSAYRRDEPQRLADTIFENFGIGVDHFIQIDFCAFKTLVDAVGGVTVPFEFPARDPRTGLNVPTTGCFTFDGEHALAYVRSRYYEYESPPGSGEWQTDGTSDLGRISRQQDFLRRVLSSVLAKGPLNPSVTGGLIESAQNYIVTDDELSPAKLLEFAGVLNDVEPGGIPTYQIEATDRVVNGDEILEPQLDSENMQEILDLFRGEMSLGEAPPQIFATTTSSVPRPSADDTTSTTADGSDESGDDDDDGGGGDGDDGDDGDGDDTDRTDGADGTADPTDTTVAPIAGAPAQNVTGIVPPRDITC